jgi:hypothetical protein
MMGMYVSVMASKSQSLQENHQIPDGVYMEGAREGLSQDNPLT